ncbi:MAG: aminotransferase class IV [Nitrospirae bacterium]|nr:aminotransferase class IV [Nitrospirota bacterium]
MRIYLNSKFVDEQRAVISVLDHGFLYGDGVFETLRAYQGRLFRSDEHLRRLKESARGLEIFLPYTLPVLRRQLDETLLVNHLKNALLRICISRGCGPIGLDPALCRKPTFVIIPRVFNGYNPRQYHHGLKIAIVSVRRTPRSVLDPQIKSANFLNNILAKIQAKRNRADEGLMLAVNGYLTEGSISNFFIVTRGRLYTPTVDLGILAGITRRLVIDLARQADIPVKETRLRPSDLYKADECFLTNTSMEIMPVAKADGFTIGDGRPGPVTRLLHEAYQEQVRLECRI